MDYTTLQHTIKFDTVRFGWSIVYIDGSHVIISKNVFLSLKIDFVYANSADPDEMPQSVAFHLGNFTICFEDRTKTHPTITQSGPYQKHPYTKKNTQETCADQEWGLGVRTPLGKSQVAICFPIG